MRQSAVVSCSLRRTTSFRASARIVSIDSDMILNITKLNFIDDLLVYKRVHCSPRSLHRVEFRSKAGDTLDNILDNNVAR